jgi:hypothetical protein
MSDRMSTKHEAEYFVREDAENKRRLALEVKKETHAAELKRLKELHFMRCPKCGLQLQEVKFKGIDVDVCFACHGIFLDRGELETITKHEGHGVVEAILNWFKPEAGAPK